MKNARFFGKITEKSRRNHMESAKPAGAWRFVSTDGAEHAVGEDEPEEFVTELSVEDAKALELAGEDVHVDVPITLTDAGQHAGSGATFSTRRRAKALVGQPGSDGADVGVIILDAGFNRDYIEAIAGPGHYGGGWSNSRVSADMVGRMTDPHERDADLHGNMIARNILSVAPGVTLYDAPILPPRVFNMKAFSSDVVGALRAIRRVIQNAGNNPNFPQHDHWILCNAWAVATSFADNSPHFRYATDRQHRLNRQVLRLADMPNVDVVFAAGNSGVFDPARFSGAYDRGHGRSIWGANGLEEVFTIGAVRGDGVAIGMSSQGPAPESLLADGSGTNQKPNLCAPSWFAEDEDPSILNTGTSTACAMFSGLLAGLRGAGDTSDSATLKAQLIAGASGGGRWNAQTGYGVAVA